MSTVVRYANPVNALLHEFFSTPTRYHANNSFRPVVDVVEQEKAYILSVDLPGLRKEDVSISVEDGVLTISGERTIETRDEKKGYRYFERSHGSFSRSFNLPENVEASQVHAQMEHGELVITIDKSEKALPHKVAIEVK